VQSVGLQGGVRRDGSFGGKAGQRSKNQQSGQEGGLSNARHPGSVAANRNASSSLCAVERGRARISHGANASFEPVSFEIQRASGLLDRPARNGLQIDHGCLDVGVAQEPLDCRQIVAGQQKVARERVAQGVRRHALGNS